LRIALATERRRELVLSSRRPEPAEGSKGSAERQSLTDEDASSWKRHYCGTGATIAAQAPLLRHRLPPNLP